MALNKATLSAAIKTYFDGFQNKSEKDKAATTTKDLADALADAIDAYVKSATITVSGVVTAGSPTTQTQTAPVTATIA